MRIGVCLTAAAVLAGCGSSDDFNPEATGPSGSNDFPESIYPANVFKGLTGQIVWYDTDGGSAAEAQHSTVMRDFTKLTGVDVQPDYGDGTPAKFFAAEQQGGSVPWSIIAFYSPQDFSRAVEQGFLEKLDPSVVPLDRVPDQFKNPAVDAYGIPRAPYAQVVAWNTDKFPESGPHPESAADFFDTQKFPGKRCANQYAESTLEQALLADGVPRDKLYPLDVKRALAKLDTIKADTHFALESDTPIQGLINGDCTVALSYNGRVYNASKKAGQPIAMTWNDAVYTYGYFGIPKGAPNAKAAQALIAMFLLDKPANAAMVEQVPYPVPNKEIPVNSYPEDVQTWLADGANLSNAVKESLDYYNAHGPDNDKEFTTWLNR